MAFVVKYRRGVFFFPPNDRKFFILKKAKKRRGGGGRSRASYDLEVCFMGTQSPHVTIGFLVIEFLHAYAQKNTIFHVENLVQQSVNATSSPSVTRKQLLLVLDCNSHLSCPFV